MGNLNLVIHVESLEQNVLFLLPGPGKFNYRFSFYISQKG